VEREAAAIPDRVQLRDLAHRLDYRERPVFTIDPDDAKDFDDALSLETLDGGELRVGIHIADVSAYVKPGTALDAEAQNRGNSTYLVGTVIPMLPEKLSNGLCSLVEGQDRLCKAVFLTFGKGGAIRESTYANTVIRSRKRLTYKQAYALLFENDLARVRALPLPPKHQTGSTGRALRDLTDAELVDLQSWIRHALAACQPPAPRPHGARQPRPRHARDEDLCGQAGLCRPTGKNRARREPPADRGIHARRQRGRCARHPRAQAALPLPRPRRAGPRETRRAPRPAGHVSSHHAATSRIAPNS
jgi:hypothetical protein